MKSKKRKLRLDKGEIFEGQQLSDRALLLVFQLSETPGLETVACESYVYLWKPAASRGAEREYDFSGRRDVAPADWVGADFLDEEVGPLVASWGAGFANAEHADACMRRGGPEGHEPLFELHHMDRHRVSLESLLRPENQRLLRTISLKTRCEAIKMRLDTYLKLLSQIATEPLTEG